MNKSTLQDFKNLEISSSQLRLLKEGFILLYEKLQEMVELQTKLEYILIQEAKKKSKI